jgi:hypothetical protein
MTRAAQLMSFIAGTAAAVALLAGFRMPAGHPNPATSLSVSLRRSAAFDLSRTGTVFDVPRLPPGRTLSTEVVVHNNRHVPLHLRPRATVEGDPEVTAGVDAEIRVSGARLFHGSLERLSDATAQRFWVAPGASATVAFTAVLRRSAAGAAAGRAADVAIGLSVDP